MIFLLYLAAMVWSVWNSKRKWRMVGVMFVDWTIAIACAIAYGIVIGNGAAAWYMWGVPSFLVPAVAGIIHSRSTQAPRLKSEIQ